MSRYRARALPQRRPVIPADDVRRGRTSISVRMSLAPADDDLAILKAYRSAHEVPAQCQGQTLTRHPDGSALVTIFTD